MKKRLEKRLNHGIGKAIHDWGMIEDKDRILVGLSGGKDSQVLFNRLISLQKRAPVEFEIVPVHIDAGFDGSLAKDLEDYVSRIHGPLTIDYNDFGVLAHSEENSESPCFLCSRLRRKRLFEIANGTNCRKIALGHNKDDIIETLFINIFYSGKISTMKPVQSFFDGSLDIIRPLSYVEEKDISAFCRMLSLPVYKNNCPSADTTKRGEIRQMLEMMYTHNKNIKGNIFRSMQNVRSEYLLDIKDDRYSKSARL